MKDETVESLVRSLAQHLDSWGGAPLVCVFDRPKTVALKWRRNGEVSEWNPVFACATLEMGIGVELCWPYRAQEKAYASHCTPFAGARLIAFATKYGRFFLNLPGRSSGGGS